MIEHLVPLFERAGVRAAFAGQEHNFQLARQRDITYVVSGAGGQLREEAPESFAAAGTVAWAAQAHLLLGRVDGATLTLTPIAASVGTARRRRSPHGHPTAPRSRCPSSSPYRTTAGLWSEPVRRGLRHRNVTRGRARDLGV